MELLTIILFNVVDIIFISVFGTHILVKGYDTYSLEKINKRLEEGKKNLTILKDVYKELRTQFFKSCIILEISLISYFIFWGTLFFFKITLN